MRADVKADEIKSTLDEVNRRLFGTRNIRTDLLPNDRDQRAVVRGLLIAIESANTYLQQPVHTNVAEALDLLGGLDEMHERGFTRDAPMIAGRHVLGFAQDAVARYLRGEEQAGPSSKTARYRSELDELNDQIDHDIERQIAEAQEFDTGCSG